MKTSHFKIPPPNDSRQFEEMILALYKNKYSGDTVQLNGRKGQNQNGVDVIIQNESIGVQCKVRNEKLKLEEIKKEVEKSKKFTPKLKKFIIATTASRDATIQTSVRALSLENKQKELFSIEILFWEDISLLFDEYPKVYIDHYPPHFIQIIDETSVSSEINEAVNLLQNNKPQSAFHILDIAKKKKWDDLKKIDKYKLLANMGVSKTLMREIKESHDLFLEAFAFNPEDEIANLHAAISHLAKKDFNQTRFHIKKVQKINFLNIESHALKIQLEDKEGRSLDNIIQDLPKEIISDQKIINILSWISVKRKQPYSKSRKLLDDLYKKLTPDDIINNLDYADFSLKNILNLDDVFTSRRIPDKFNSELKIIIKLYRDIIDIDNEIKKFTPELYSNCSLAYELIGDTEEALYILKCGINQFKDIDWLKAEFARIIYKENQNFEKSISILEEIESKTTDINFLLCDLHCKNNQPLKSIDLLEKIINDHKTPTSDIDEAKKYLPFILISMNKIEEAESKMKEFFESDEEDILLLIIKSKIEEQKNNINEKENYLKKAIELEKTKISPMNERQQLANELYFSKMYEDCEPLLEKIVNQNAFHPMLLKLLHVYFTNNNNKKFIQLSIKAIKSFPEDINFVLSLHDVYHDKLKDIPKAIECCKNFFTKNPENDVIKVFLMYNYMLNNDVNEVKKMAREKINIENLPPQLIENLAKCYMNIKETGQLLNLLYQAIKLYPKDSTFQTMYSSFFMMHPQKIKDHLGEVNQVKVDHCVDIKNLTSKEIHNILIEEDSDIYHPNHQLSKKLLEKKKNEEFVFNNQKYKIIEIKSKYIHKHQEILKNAPLVSNPDIQSISISKDANAEEISKKISTSFTDNNYLENQKKINNQLIQMYANQKITLGFMSKHMNRHPLELINSLIQSSDNKFLSSAIETEDDQSPIKTLSARPNILLDITSLFMIHSLDFEEYLQKSDFQFYVSQSTTMSLQNLIITYEPHAKKGLSVINSEGIHLMFSPDQIKSNLKLLQKTLNWIKNQCNVKPISPDLQINPQTRSEAEKITGDESFLDSILSVYNEDNMIFLSEDGALRTYANKQFNILGVRLFDIIEYLEKQNILNSNKAIHFKSELVKFNQTYIPINHHMLFYLLKNSNYDANHFSFQRGLFFLRGISKLPDSINVAVKFLFELYSTPFISIKNQELIAKEALDALLFNRIESRIYIANFLKKCITSRPLLLPTQEKDIYNLIDKWLSFNL